MAKSVFQEALESATADLLKTGYQSQDQVLGWLNRLRTAAHASLVPESVVRRRLAGFLDRTYRGTLQGIRKRHVGLSQFTLRQLEPGLRRELDQRILTATSLIKDNRAAAVEKTLQRFQGWATAIPKGGTKAQTRGEATEDLGRAMKSVKWKERRVETDQGHKLVASINQLVAEGGEAIAAVWHSHWREAGYDYRESHKRLDKKVLLIPKTWAVDEGYVKKTGALYTDQVEAPAQDVNCRCYYSYLYGLADLPEELLTARGKLALKGANRAADRQG